MGPRFNKHAEMQYMQSIDELDIHRGIVKANQIKPAREERTQRSNMVIKNKLLDYGTS